MEVVYSPGVVGTDGLAGAGAVLEEGTEVFEAEGIGAVAGSGKRRSIPSGFDEVFGLAVGKFGGSPDEVGTGGRRGDDES